MRHILFHCHTNRAGRRRRGPAQGVRPHARARRVSLEIPPGTIYARLPDPVIHAQARLRVMVAPSVLTDGDRIAFPRLPETLGMTAGNLSALYAHSKRSNTSRQLWDDLKISPRTPGRSGFRSPQPRSSDQSKKPNTSRWPKPTETTHLHR